jgi:hypothetical protein
MRAGAAPILVLVLIAICGTSGCESEDGAGMAGGAILRVGLTDAPSDLLESAEVRISRVWAQRAEGGEPVHLRPAGAEPLTFDLMELRDGLEAFLAESAVPADVYDQLRLVVEEAEVTLVPGQTFDDGSRVRRLQVPSGATSGLKVQLADPIRAEEGEVLLVVVDFDVDESFVLQGRPDTPAGLKGVLLKPVLREKRRGRF